MPITFVAPIGARASPNRFSPQAATSPNPSNAFEVAAQPKEFVATKRYEPTFPGST